MKKLTFLLMAFVLSFGQAQTTLEDFEGDAPTTELADGFVSANVAANPDNAAENALELVTSAAGDPWQGAVLFMQNNKIDMTTADKTMTIDVYSLTPRDFLFKLSSGDVGGVDTAQESKTAASHGGTGWETLSLDFNVGADLSQPGYNPPNDQFSSILFFPLFNIATDGWCEGCGPGSAIATTTYVDNIVGIAGDAIEGPTGPALPTEAAPTPPPSNAAGVRSIFSDAYTDIPNVNWNPDFGPNLAVSDIVANDDNLKTFDGPGFVGVDWSANKFDAADMTNFHIDFWTNDPELINPGKVFNFKLVNFGDGDEEQNALQYDINAGSTPVIATGQWVSVDAPLSAFLGVPQAGFPANARDGLAQFVITTNLEGDIYVDNVYLYNPALSTEEFSATNFRVYPNPTTNNWNIVSNTTINAITVFDILGKQVTALTPNASEVEISTSNITTGIYFARIDGINGSKTVKLIKE